MVMSRSKHAVFCLGKLLETSAAGAKKAVFVSDISILSRKPAAARADICQFGVDFSEQLETDPNVPNTGSAKGRRRRECVAAAISSCQQAAWCSGLRPCAVEPMMKVPQRKAASHYTTPPAGS
ncbi:unnamed protein product [Caenorhabditis auriculariae]|uniref:Uncharacterized protein n=1 Tax=Caenorhabditis auriculariae TaxID=2777116 RepID=A0A8S1HL09_9PELO|nr:unnamed protein product [Caenorhabditis auriculariae]